MHQGHISIASPTDHGLCYVLSAAAVLFLSANHLPVTGTLQDAKVHVIMVRMVFNGFMWPCRLSQSPRWRIGEGCRVHGQDDYESKD
jgi:hypothetical protein